jgi:hypothetical protein
MTKQLSVCAAALAIVLGASAPAAASASNDGQGGGGTAEGGFAYGPFGQRMGHSRAFMHDFAFVPGYHRNWIHEDWRGRHVRIH